MEQFDMDIGWMPKTPWDILSATDVSVQILEYMKSILKEFWDNPNFSFKIWSHDKLLRTKAEVL